MSDYATQHNYRPLATEISDGLGIGLDTVYSHLGNLESLGVLAWQRLRRRSIVVTAKGLAEIGIMRVAADERRADDPTPEEIERAKREVRERV